LNWSFSWTSGFTIVALSDGKSVCALVQVAMSNTAMNDVISWVARVLEVMDSG
jgi:hypothetical protein